MHRSSVRRGTALAVLLAGGALVGAPPAAAAARGVSIDVGRIAVEQALVPGGGYRLPLIGVRNPGDERTRYRMGISIVDGQQAAAPPDGWFAFEPAEFTLDPGETQRVSSRIALPTGAAAADYSALLGARIVAAGSRDAGASVGAAAAAQLTFTVEPASALEAWWRMLERLFLDHRPWSWLLPLVTLLALAGRRLHGRYTFTVGRRA